MVLIAILFTALVLLAFQYLQQGTIREVRLCLEALNPGKQASKSARQAPKKIIRTSNRCRKK